MSIRSEQYIRCVTVKKLSRIIAFVLLLCTCIGLFPVMNADAARHPHRSDSAYTGINAKEMGDSFATTLYAITYGDSVAAYLNIGSR